MKNFFSKSHNPQKPGRFIVLDGIDGSGKSTQLDLLHRELAINGYPVEQIHFPQHGQSSAAMVDSYLAGDYGQLGPYPSSVLYALDRFDASFKIRRWLAEGKVVLCDRYVTANAAHQGGKIADRAERLKFFKWLDNLEYGIFGIPKPDLIIILNVPAEAAVQMLRLRGGDQKHKDAMHETSLEHLRSSYQTYLEISRLFPNAKQVNCVEGLELLSPDQIHNRIWELVRRIGLKDLSLNLKA
ncbi:MAG: thymidylate kinase [Patescibacteria group bacterium]|nr:thymidylate kinase [Patescibacteria group bacterium]